MDVGRSRGSLDREHERSEVPSGRETRLPAGHFV